MDNFAKGLLFGAIVILFLTGKIKVGKQKVQVSLNTKESPIMESSESYGGGVK